MDSGELRPHLDAVDGPLEPALADVTVTALCKGHPRRRLSTRIQFATGLFAVIMLAVSGCSSSSGATGAGDAQAIVDHIAQRIPTVRKTVVVTAENDPNKLLGTPNAYTSKTEFIDTRLDQGVDVVGGVPAGGSVEVFADKSKAEARRDYLRGAAVAESATAAAAEYAYVSGPILLRVSHNLTPFQAAEYQAALDKITGVLGALVERHNRDKDDDDDGLASALVPA
ncbi:MAG: hypothetical protein ACR2G2_17795 [Pseudonocardia sp.]